MADGLTDHRRAARAGASDGAPIVRPAELVELSERVYRDVFRAGLWVAIGTAGYSLGLVAVQVGEIDRTLAAGICVAIALGLLAAARQHRQLYERLRRRPAWGIAVAGTLAAAHVAVGSGSEILFAPTLIVLGCLGAAVSQRLIFAAALLVAIAQASVVPTYDLSSHDARSVLSAAAAILFAPLLFCALVDRLARFMLDLHRATTTAAGAGPAPIQDSQPSRGAFRRLYGLGRSNGPRALLPGGAVKQPPPDTFARAIVTARQRQVIALASAGQRHSEIAECLAISTGQVTRHLTLARARVGVDTTEQLVAWAIGAGLIPASESE